MKLADDALIAVMLCLQKGLSEGIDISEMLRSMELVQNPDGRLGLDPKSDFVRNGPRVGDIWEGD